MKTKKAKPIPRMVMRARREVIRLLGLRGIVPFKSAPTNIQLASTYYASCNKGNKFQFGRRDAAIYLVSAAAGLANWSEEPSSSSLPVRVAKPATPRRSLSYKIANSPDFLESAAWKRLRYRVLIRDGRRCCCCGATPETGAVMNVDHIKPRRTHPELAARSGQPPGSLWRLQRWEGKLGYD
jgi:5-methylcytosine-specific restriction endonuclease McrA